MAGPAGPAADVAAVLAALIAARGIGAGDLARQVDCTASHLSNILNRHCRPSPALAARLDTRPVDCPGFLGRDTAKSFMTSEGA